MELSALIPLLTCAFGLGTIVAGVVGLFIGSLITRQRNTPPKRIGVLKDLLVEVSNQIRAADEEARINQSATMAFEECTLEVAFETETQNSGKSSTKIEKIYAVELGSSLKQTNSNKITLKYMGLKAKPYQASANVNANNSDEELSSDFKVELPPDELEKER